MFSYVKKDLTFFAPNGALSVHPGYTAISKHLTQCDADGSKFFKT